MTHAAIPPMPLAHDSPPQQTLDVLSQRLQAAEEDAKGLVSVLREMGMNPNPNRDHRGERVSPYTPRMADPDILHRNYETLVSRVCKLESIIQSLRLNICTLQAEVDLRKKETIVTEEKLAQLNEVNERELKKINRDLGRCRKELKEDKEARLQAEEEVRRLQEALEVATSTRADTANKVEDLKSTKQKLSRQLAGLREELAREQNLRSSLEESHNTLLSRIHQLEEVVEAERGEVKTLSTDCSVLRQDGARARQRAQEDHQARIQLEEQLKLYSIELESKKAKIQALENEKGLMVGEMEKIKIGYADLNKQLEGMQQLFDDHRDTHIQLEQENSQLHKALSSASEEAANLREQFEQQIQTEREEWEEKFKDQSEVVFVKEELRKERKEKEELEGRNEQLRNQNKDLKIELDQQAQIAEEEMKKLQAKMESLQQTLDSLENEKDGVLKDKENLLEEVNQAVDGMAEERTRLQAELQQAHLEIKTLTQASHQLEQENTRLMERMGAVEQQQQAQHQVDHVIAEMTEQKNKLAYEKGKLQSKLEQLQRDMESLSGSKAELAQLRKINQALEGKYTKAQNDLGNCKISLQRLESQLKQVSAVGQRKEEDFALAIQARDEAMKETQRLAAHIQALEERERQKGYSYQQSLSDAKEDNKKIAATLESVVASHSQLQRAMEHLQTELGKKDTQIVQLRKERSQVQQATHGMQKEVETLQARLIAMETLESNEIGPLREALEKCKNDNIKMANSLDGLLSSNGKLQSTVERLQNEVEKKNYLMEQLKEARGQELEERKQEVQSYEERLDNMRQQLRQERDKAVKKTNKDITEVRKQNEELVSKNGELSRANHELRHRATELEHQVKEQKEKISRHRSQIEHLHKLRQEQEETISKLRVIADEVKELERMRDEYAKKNEEQVNVVQSFMSQIASLQAEIRGLSEAQLETSQVLEDQEYKLQSERKQREELHRKYRVSTSSSQRESREKNYIGNTG
ncbi:coiled-coil domain-containing protein 150-like [Lingula anatina]|uniref:Coiled-coil domain-containing protein 150-like n=1 Tax=Lingula anatina TaxID=7574 RepID=A0A1S3K045_LINAN|nr:coiled-coil domain-containing protein 150-like [Lingula anatina]XP_023932794.1 coiled-coil domain-containing protein 150-like [Lingula anatina]|eukprot:XP_013416003.1 coiled-coil domain-containing protein 150-like [Lingula anatina]